MGKARYNYMQEIKSLKSQKPEDLDLLVTRMLNGSAEARDMIVLSQLSLVVQTAQEFVNMGLEEEELIAEGNCGLMQALDDYQPSQGDFSAYLREGIRKAISTAVEIQAERIRERQALEAKVNSIINAIQVLTKKLERIPTEKEIAEHLKIDLEELEYLIKLAGFSKEGKGREEE